MTLDELSPFDLKRERLGRQLENDLLSKREHADELAAIAAEERADACTRRADRAQARDRRELRS